ncbi:hypothetical protein [Parageobacillus thermoglucosidasius]|uniref:hypothetical protein n=1 Tax=Parageobacillus thermoglucosidasius TaxID=1426 RepID=UPI0001D17349|nr:hypothetical protein [Parageobacillus thermoglucosidasius]AEH46762.1 hypothetical protein Geoth_0764 [Parageobacillus thermoglucosidasius C56-YS93]
MIEILVGLVTIAILIIFVLPVVGAVIIFESRRIPVWFKCVIGIVAVLAMSYAIGYGVLNG